MNTARLHHLLQAARRFDQQGKYSDADAVTRHINLMATRIANLDSTMAHAIVPTRAAQQQPISPQVPSPQPWKIPQLNGTIPSKTQPQTPQNMDQIQQSLAGRTYRSSFHCYISSGQGEPPSTCPVSGSQVSVL